MDTNSYRKVDFLEKLFAFIPGDLQHLTDIFLSSLSDQTQDFWGWDWWESEKYDDDTFTFYHPDVEEKLVKLFSIKALKILGNMEDTDISRISLVVPPDKVYILRDDRTLLGFLSSIEGNQERLSSVLNSKDIGRIVFLKKNS